MSTTPSAIPHTVSSGNVFRDLGFENPDLYLAKAHVAETIRETLEQRGLEGSTAAAQVGVAPPTLQQVLEGDLDAVTLDELVALLRQLGHRFQVVITPDLAPA